jgi:uncharacterized RDD family membrane protein YckC
VSRPVRLGVTGHYAGPVSRAAGAFVDGFLIFILFTAGAAGINLLVSAIFGVSPAEDTKGWVWIVSLATWAFFYEVVSLAVAGKTPGKALAGLRVVSKDGSVLPMRRAIGRTLAFPLSLIFFGIGFLGIVFGREHKALHDVIARTAVVYDWGARKAELPGPLSAFIAREAGTEYTETRPV